MGVGVLWRTTEALSNYAPVVTPSTVNVPAGKNGPMSWPLMHCFMHWVSL